jgi:hypothetical protein
VSYPAQNWYWYRMREGVALAASPDDVVVVSQNGWDAAEADGVAEWLPEPGDGKGAWSACEWVDEPTLRREMCVDAPGLPPEQRVHRESILAAVARAAS